MLLSEVFCFLFTNCCPSKYLELLASCAWNAALLRMGVTVPVPSDAIACFQFQFSLFDISYVPYMANLRCIYYTTSTVRALAHSRKMYCIHICPEYLLCKIAIESTWRMLW